VLILPPRIEILGSLKKGLRYPKPILNEIINKEKRLGKEKESESLDHVINRLLKRGGTSLSCLFEVVEEKLVEREAFEEFFISKIAQN
jgi:hypothetical protein